MKKLLWLLVLLAPLFHVEHAHAATPLQIYCIQATSTPCNTVSNPGSGSQGDMAWLFSGKTNANFNFLAPLWAIPAGQYVCNPTGIAGALGYCNGGGGGGSGVTSVDVSLGTCSSSGPVTSSGTVALTGCLFGILQGGTGTASPNLVAGSGISITGTWPNQTITSLSSGGSVTSVNVSLSGCTSSGAVTTSGTIALNSCLFSVAQGGTGLNVGVSGGVPYFATTNSMASSALLTNHALVLGGGAGAAPKVDASLGTSTTVLHGAAAGDPTWGAVNLATDVSGTLPIGGGGTGATSLAAANLPVFSGSFAANDCLKASSTTPLTIITAGFGCGTGAASSITPGTTTIIGASAPCLLDNSSGTVMGCASVSQTLSLNSGVLGTTVPQRTVTTSPAVGAGDMGGVIYLNITGGGTVTLPAISSTVFATGMSVSLVNYSASTAGISTTPTVNAGGGCVSGTGIPAGDAWEIVSNGATLDCNQTISSATGGGTVTHTGSLTANAVVIGNGTADTKVVAGITSDGVSALNLGVPGTSVGKTVYGNATSGTITVQAPTGALGTITNTLQAAGDTFVYRATTDTLTNKSISGASNTLSNIALSSLATQAANTVVMNATGSSASPTAVTTVTYLIDTGTTFTAAGTGACATRSTLTGGTSAGRLTCTGTTGASTVTITLPTATNGWRCSMDDETTANTLRQTGQSATTCVISGTVNANDVLTFSAIGY